MAALRTRRDFGSRERLAKRIAEVADAADEIGTGSPEEGVCTRRNRRGSAAATT